MDPSGLPEVGGLSPGTGIAVQGRRAGRAASVDADASRQAENRQEVRRGLPLVGRRCADDHVGRRAGLDPALGQS